jgi:hypothetical protein
MTRGRQSNTVYTTNDQPTNDAAPPAKATSAREGLAAIVRNTGTEQSARQTRQQEHDHWQGLAQMAAEYQTIANHALTQGTAAIIHRALDQATAEQITTAPHFPRLVTQLGNSHGQIDTVAVLRANAGTITSADDPTSAASRAISLATIRTATHGPNTMPRRPRRTLIVGLIPKAHGPMTTEMRQALAQCEQLIEQRATVLRDHAAQTGASWLTALAPPLPDQPGRTRWQAQARTIAAYRNLYGITSSELLGPPPATPAQRLHHARARAAVTALATPVQASATTPAPLLAHPAPSVLPI